MNKDSMSFLSALYNPGEIVATYGPHPSYLTYQGPIEAAIPAEYITINPVIDGRKATNMADYRNFLLEMDKTTLPHQLGLLKNLGEHIPIRTIVYGGNKSYHATISLADTLITGKDGEIRAFLYSEYFKRIRAAAEAIMKPLCTETYMGNLVDPACSDASRLTRMGGATNRHWKEEGRPHTPQNLISTGGLLSSSELESFLGIYEPESTESRMLIPASAVYTGTFERTLASQTHLKGLRSILCIPETWGAPEGNHPHLYRYTHWAIDATGVQEDEFQAYVKRYTAPYLLSLSYPLWKVEEAVAGAYRVRKIRKPPKLKQGA